VYYKFSVRFRPKQDARVHYNFGSNDVYLIWFFTYLFSVLLYHLTYCCLIASDYTWRLKMLHTHNSLTCNSLP
jgi:cytochrome c biogenesis protein ResB